jgi:hypothetical protein
MQVKAIYEDGVINFERPLRFKHRKFEVLVNVPDAELELDNTYNLPPEVMAMAREMEEKLDHVRNAPLPAEEDLPPLTQKQLDRIEAFALRDEVKGLR